MCIIRWPEVNKEKESALVSLPDAKEYPSSYRRCKMDKSLRKMVPVGSFGRDKLGLMVVYPNILG